MSRRWRAEIEIPGHHRTADLRHNALRQQPQEGDPMYRAKQTAVAILIGAALITTVILTGLGQATSQDQSAPKDLRALLIPRHSEAQLVVTRYNADRALLVGNFAGVTNTGGRGRGAAPAAAPPVVISANRIARLKRFDMAWQAALGRINNPSLSSQA